MQVLYSHQNSACLSGSWIFSYFERTWEGVLEQEKIKELAHRGGRTPSLQIAGNCEFTRTRKSLTLYPIELGGRYLCYVLPIDSRSADKMATSNMNDSQGQSIRIHTIC